MQVHVNLFLDVYACVKGKMRKRGVPWTLIGFQDIRTRLLV